MSSNPLQPLTPNIPIPYRHPQQHSPFSPLKRHKPTSTSSSPFKRPLPPSSSPGEVDVLRTPQPLSLDLPFEPSLPLSHLDEHHNHDHDHDHDRDSKRVRIDSPTPSPVAGISFADLQERYLINPRPIPIPSGFPSGRKDEIKGKGKLRETCLEDWFSPSAPTTRHSSQNSCGDIRVDEIPVVVQKKEVGVWRRKRQRLGVGVGSSRVDSLISLAQQRPGTPTPHFLSSLVTSLSSYNPFTPPSLLLLPSLHSPTGRPRDFCPALCVAFNNIAKTYDAPSAKEEGLRRLIAVAGEEGGVRVLDVDEGLGGHREEKGWWWRAHSNAVFDVKWSRDDKKILTASGDQTARLHALDSPTPTLLATLKGHTSSIKTATFFDPSRSQSEAPSSIVATAGRDGNILLYDLRCQGRIIGEEKQATPGRRRSTRERYSAGVPGFAAKDGPCLYPVAVIQQAHGDGSRRASNARTATRSVTSLVALQAMPGILASGGSSDGIVKLWDLRSTPSSRDSSPKHQATYILPDPTRHPSRRPRAVHALAENPTTGDLFSLTGDSKIHVLRPSLSQTDMDESSIQPEIYSDPSLLVSSFYIRMSISSDGKYLATGSSRGGLMTWDINCGQKARATRLGLGPGDGKEREVSAVDWGRDMVAGCSDDLATRIWRSNYEASRWLSTDPMLASQEWAGPVC